MKTLITILLLALPLHAEPRTLTWDKNPETDVVSYRLTFVKVPELARTVTTSGLVATTPDLSPGVWTFSVAAINAAGFISAESKVIVTTISVPPPSAPTGLRFVLSETSNNLQDWEPSSVTVLDPTKQTSKFVRNSILTLEELTAKLTPTF